MFQSCLQQIFVAFIQNFSGKNCTENAPSPSSLQSTLRFNSSTASVQAKVVQHHTSQSDAVVIIISTKCCGYKLHDGSDYKVVLFSQERVVNIIVNRK